MVGSMRSGDSSSAGGYSGDGGQDSPSESRGGPGSGAGSSNSPSSSGNNGGLGGPTSNNSGNSNGGGNSSRGPNSPSSSGNNGGLGGPTSNNSGNRSSPSTGGMGGNSNANGGGTGGGLNSAGNRASGAGPGASGNTSTTGGGYGSPTGGGGMAGGLNSAGNRTSGAGPGASANTTTTGNGFGSPTDSQRRADMAQQARAAETTSMKDLAREKALGVISKAEAGVKDPYSTLSGGLVTTNLADMTVKDAITLSKTQWKGKLANVVGAYQIKDTTLEAVAKQMGLLDAKMTPAVQDQLAVGLMQQRANLATVNGQIDVDKFAQELSKEWASVADPTTGVSHYAKNGIDKSSISVTQARELAKDLVANGVVTAGKAVGSITSNDVSSVQTQAPGVSHFASTYMGSKTTAASPSATGTTSQQNDPSGLPAGTYPGQVVGDGIAPTFAAKQPAKTQQNDPSSLPAGTYPAYDPSGLPAAPALPAAAAPAPAVAPQRSLGQKVAATAIDAGLGMLPGVGMAAGLINGGLALTGNRTLGEHVVDSFVNGEGGPGPDSGTDRMGGGTRIIEDKNKTTVPSKDESFEDRYMAFVDQTSRPKPSERWNYDTAGYA